MAAYREVSDAPRATAAPHAPIPLPTALDDFPPDAGPLHFQPFTHASAKFGSSPSGRRPTGREHGAVPVVAAPVQAATGPPVCRRWTDRPDPPVRRGICDFFA